MPLLLPPALDQVGPLLAFSIYWHLPILILVISLVYSATRYDEWGPILHEAFRWGVRLAGFLLIIVVILYILSSWI